MLNLPISLSVEIVLNSWIELTRGNKMIWILFDSSIVSQWNHSNPSCKREKKPSIPKAFRRREKTNRDDDSHYAVFVACISPVSRKTKETKLRHIRKRYEYNELPSPMVSLRTMEKFSQAKEKNICVKTNDGRQLHVWLCTQLRIQNEPFTHTHHTTHKSVYSSFVWVFQLNIIFSKRST